MIRRSLDFTESESRGVGPNELAAERAAIKTEMLAALERHGRRRGDILAEERRAMKDRVIDVSRRAN